MERDQGFGRYRWGRWRLRRRLRGWLAIGIVGALIAGSCASESDVLRNVAPDVAYAYDDLGRLRAVTEADGSTVVYDYDAAGNLLGTERHPSDRVSVIEVLPRRAAPGTPVRVFGTAFARDAGKNTVTFGGVEAAVTGATPVELTAVVPEGAGSGPVAVAAPDGSSESPEEFDILVDRAPAVEGFSPEVVAAGDEVVIRGRGFTGDPLLDQVFLSDGDRAGVYLTVVEASEGELRATVPPVAASGRLSVATPWGTGSAEGQLRVIPAVERPSASPGFGVEGDLTLLEADDVGGWARAELGEPAEVELPAGQAGMVRFEGRARARLTLDVGGGLDCWDVAIGLVAPDGLALQRAVGADDPLPLWCGGGADAAVTLPADGDYTLVVEPRAESPGGTATVVLEDAGELSPPERLSDEELAERHERMKGQVPEELKDIMGGEPPLPDERSDALGAPTGEVTDGDERFGVDLYSGTLQFSETDLSVDDVAPLSITRGYQPFVGSDFGTGEGAAVREATRAFGVGSGLTFDMRLEIGSGQSAQLVLSTGMAIPYRRVSQGVDNDDALLEHFGAPTPFYGSTIVWNGWGWDLRLEDGSVFVFVDGYLRAMYDPQGTRVTIVRERSRDQLGRASTGNVAAVYSPHGRWMSFGYDEEGRISEARNHLGDTLTYSYTQVSGTSTTSQALVEGYGLVSGVEYRDPAGEVLGEITYRYDDENRLVAVGDGDDETLTIGYDADGRVASQELADGSGFTFSYATETETFETLDGEPQEVEVVAKVEVTDPAGMVRRVEFEGGHWVSDTWAAGSDNEQTVSAERDADTGFITELISPDGQRSSYDYDPDGNMVSVLEGEGSPAAAETVFDYDADRFGLTSATGPDGLATSFAYDDAGNLASEAHPGDLGATYGHDASGRVTSVTDPAGATTGLDYELAHRLVTVSGAAGADPDEADADASAASASEYYDAAGRLAASTDPAGGVTVYGYDAFDQLVSATDPSGGEIAFDYDADGNLASLTDQLGNITSFTYNDFGQMVERADPAGGSDQYSYDDAGRVATHTDRRGVETSYEYDALGQLTRIAFGANEEGEPESAISYSYDPAGRLTEADDTAYGVVTLAYDDLGRLVSEISPAGEISYSYDKAGRRTTMALPDGTETDYGYDDAGRLASITQGDLSVEASRDEHGRIESLDLPNGVAADYTYDDLSRLARIDYGSGIGALRYNYDASGRRTGASGDLATVDMPDEPASEPDYGPRNEVISWDDRELTYDAAGNLLSDGASSYTWDARGQLVAIEGQGAQAEFSYDPFGRRVQATFDGETTEYLYDGGAIAQQGTSDGGTFTYLTGPSLDEVYARTGPDGEVTTFVTDAQGSVIGLAGSGGELATSYTYTPHGERSAEGDADPNPFGFTGREHDPTGLIYYRARYYDPATGRFISEDPLGFDAGDPNLYAYTFGDPVNFTDPTGTQAAFVAGTLGCVVSAIEALNIQFDIFDFAFIDTIQDLVDGRISDEEAQIIWDWAVEASQTVSESLMYGCAASFLLAALPLDYLVVKGIGAFGRSAWQRLVQRFPTLAKARIPWTKTKPGLPAPSLGLSDDVLRLTEQNLTDSGDTVLGHFPGYIDKARAKGASYFDIGQAWKTLTPAQRQAANQHFLDVAADRGDSILLSISKSDIRPDSALAWEVEYLTQERGYVWVNQWSLRPGV